MNQPLTVTLSAIRDSLPCVNGWEKLLKYLGKTKADDEPLLLETILDSNGLDDALWCLRALKGHDRDCRLYAVWGARKVEHLMTDERSRRALDVAERFAYGKATRRELAGSYEGAWEVLREAYRKPAWLALATAKCTTLCTGWDAAAGAASLARRTLEEDFSGTLFIGSVNDFVEAIFAERFRQMCREGGFFGETR